MLSRNVGKQLPHDAALIPQKSADLNITPTLYTGEIELNRVSQKMVLQIQVGLKSKAFTSSPLNMMKTNRNLIISGSL
jgi:hypothetical protein